MNRFLIKALGITLLTLAVVVISTPCFARTLHVFAFGDTVSPDISKATRADLASIEGLLEENISKQDLIQHQIFPNSSFKQVMQRIRNSNIRPEDAVFVYFTGHGFMEAQNQYLKLSDSDICSRHDFEGVLTRTNASLVVFLTDTCAGPGESLVERDRCPRVSLSSIPFTKPLFRRLFWEHTGFLSVNSCQPGQLALTMKNKSLGGVFWNGVSQAVHEHMGDENAAYGWSQLLEEVKENCPRIYKEENPDRKVQINGRIFNQRSQDIDITTNTLKQLKPTGGYYTDNAMGLTVAEVNNKIVVTNALIGSPSTKLSFGNDNRYWYLENGDEVVQANGQFIRTLVDFKRAVSGIRGAMPLVIRHPKTHELYHFKIPVGDAPRLGVWLDTQFTGGARIVSVVPESPATRVHRFCPKTRDQRGDSWFLEAGDTVTKVNGRRISGHSGLSSATLNGQKQVRMTVRSIRDKKEYEFFVDLP